MSQVDVTRQFSHVQSGAWPGGKSDFEILAQRDTLHYRSETGQPHSSELLHDSTVVESLHIPQLQHQRVRALHGDHQPLYIAPPPAHFFPSFPSQSSPTHPVLEHKTSLQTPPKAPPLIRSQSAIELPSTRNFGQQAKPNPITRPPPVLATSSNVTPVPPATTTPTRGKRGRKPKDPVAHAAKKEAKEKKRLEKEAAMAELAGQHIVFVPEDITAIAARADVLPRPSSSGLGQSRPSTSSHSASRPSSSGMGIDRSSPFTSEHEHKKRSADDAFVDETGIDALWLDTEESSLDMDSSWTMSSPLSPITSPETGGLGIFLNAPPSTPIDEFLSSSAQLGINPALLFHEDSFAAIAQRNKSGRLVRALKSPLEILAIDEYPLSHSTIASNPPSTPSDDSCKKLGLMDLMLHRTENEDKPSPKKKLRPDLVFSTTKRGKAVVSLQKNAPPEEPTAPVEKTPEAETDLRSLVLKRRKEVWGDDVGTEVTRIAVHRRLTSRKTSAGLMSPLSPKASMKRDLKCLDSDSESSDSSDSEEDESSSVPSQVTPIATPTNPLAGQSMQKSFSAPGFFASELFSSLPVTPQDDLSFAPRTNHFDVENMRCKTCGMLFRKQHGLLAHERTCMVKQTPFIPYDFLRSDHEGKQLFGEDVILTPRNLAAQLGFDSPLVGKGEMKSFSTLAPPLLPKETVAPDESIEGSIKAFGPAKGQTRCICGKSEKSVPGVMVQCGKCEYWLHTRCLKIKARDLPDEYFCPACMGNAMNQVEDF